MGLSTYVAVRVSHSKLVLVRQTKSDSNTPMNEKFTLPGKGLPVPHPGARPGEGAQGRAPGGPVLVLGSRQGTAQKRDMGILLQAQHLLGDCRGGDPGGPLDALVTETSDWDMERHLTGGEGA